MSKVIRLIYILTNSIQGFISLTSYQHLFFILIQEKWNLSCLNLHFSMAKHLGHFFIISCLFIYFYCLIMLCMLKLYYVYIYFKFLSVLIYFLFPKLPMYYFIYSFFNKLKKSIYLSIPRWTCVELCIGPCIYGTHP